MQEFLDAAENELKQQGHKLARQDDLLEISFQHSGKYTPYAYLIQICRHGEYVSLAATTGIHLEGPFETATAQAALNDLDNSDQIQYGRFAIVEQDIVYQTGFFLCGDQDCWLYTLMKNLGALHHDLARCYEQLDLLKEQGALPQ